MKINININRKLLPMKGHYLFLNSGSAPIAPFIPIIVRGLGFSAFVVGTIYTIVPLLTVLSKPLLGGISDKFQCQKGMFLLLLCVQGFFFFIIQWMPSLPSTKVELSCGNGTYLNLHPAEYRNWGNQQPANGSLVYCQFSCEDRTAFHPSHMQLKNQSQPYNSTLFNFNKTSSSDREKYPIEALISSTLEQNADSFVAKVDWLSYQGSNWYRVNCESPITSSCKGMCDDHFINEIMNSPPISDNNVINYYQFWLVLIIVATAKIATAGSTSIGDAICFNLLGDKKSEFGMQRLWGAAGWGLMAFVSGLVVDTLSEGSSEKNYFPGFIIGLVFLILDLFICFRLEYENTAPPPLSIMKDMAKVLSNWHIWIFMLWCVICGIYTAMIWNFLFWFLEDVAANNGFTDMTYIKTLEGLALTMHCYLGEIPFFFFSSWILKKIGHQRAMVLVLWAFALRFIIYSYLTNPWWTLPAETLNGITFGIYYSTMATYTSSFAPPGTESTIQNFICCLYDGLGVSIGSFIGGLMIQELGGSQTFWILGLSSAVFSGLLIIIQFFMKDEKSHSSDLSVAALEISKTDK